MNTKAKICFFSLGLCSLFVSLPAVDTTQASTSISGEKKQKGINLEADVHVAKFLQLADEAWTEVLKEKIKEHIRAESKGLDQFAKLVAEANYERWKTKTQEKGLDNMDELLKAYIQQMRVADPDSSYN